MVINFDWVDKTNGAEDVMAEDVNSMATAIKNIIIALNNIETTDTEQGEQISEIKALLEEILTTNSTQDAQIENILQQLENLATGDIEGVVDAIVGSLSDLETNDKSTIVGAINEVKDSIGKHDFVVSFEIEKSSTHADSLTVYNTSHTLAEITAAIQNKKNIKFEVHNMVDDDGAMLTRQSGFSERGEGYYFDWIYNNVSYHVVCSIYDGAWYGEYYKLATKDDITVLETQIGDINTALENKTDKVTITTLSDTVLAVDFAEMYNSEIRTGELMSISFTFGNDAYEEDYTSGISFDSGETPTSIDYTDSGILNWVGTDCATSDGLSIFQPSADTHYDIVFYFNGAQFIGLVNGFVPSTGNEAV